MSNTHSLIYKYVPKERHRLCRRIHALQAHVAKCKKTMARSMVGIKTAVYEVTWGEEASQWKRVAVEMKTDD